MSTLSVATIKSTSSATPPAIQDSGGTEVGTFCRAWVNVQANGTINTSFNVSSVTAVATGIYKVTMTNALADANYCFASSVVSTASGDRGISVFSTNSSDNAAVVAPTTSAFYYKTMNNSGTAFNEPHTVIVFR